ncbi:hypothetical protein C8R45DRAFT_1069657 [Mycena sanguinolenta]|nr:hypothetical protein C8R45DRAFT_1069657 [Mycena sanguinolenta]
MQIQCREVQLTSSNIRGSGSGSGRHCPAPATSGSSLNVSELHWQSVYQATATGRHYSSVKAIPLDPTRISPSRENMNRVRRPTVDSSNGQWNMVEVSGRALPEAPPKAAGDRRRLADVTILSWRLVGNIIPQHLLMSDTVRQHPVVATGVHQWTFHRRAYYS